MRTDKHRNPTAFDTDVAALALKPAVEYNQGDPFQIGNKTYYTASLIGNPIAVTIKLIDTIGFTTKRGNPRWTHTNIPKFIWDRLSYEDKRDVIGLMYQREGGTDMRVLF